MKEVAFCCGKACANGICGFTKTHFVLKNTSKMALFLKAQKTKDG